MSAPYKTSLPLLEKNDASPEGRELLEGAETNLGFLPKMYQGMANVPGVLSTYLHGYDRFRKASGFNAAEQEVVFLAISHENGCDYCMAAHSTIADMAKVPGEVTDALREGAVIPDEKLAALDRFTRTMVRSRGNPKPEDVQAFHEAGYNDEHILAVVLAIGVKTLSNYSNHLFHTPVDEVFSARLWKAE